ncbi:MAG: DsbA family protein [Terriglobia bacterium]
MFCGKTKALLLLFLLTGFLSAGAQTQQAPAQVSPSEALRNKIAHYLRERFSVPGTATLTVAPLRPSIYQGFELTTVTIEDAGHRQTSDFYVSKNGDYLVEGNIFGLNENPQTEVERLIHTEGEPSAGPANAPVTIVEYADLECPHCAEEQQFIEKDLLPKYGGKIRVIFKEFPLFSIHPWAVTAAMANECAYQLNPSDFLRYRDLIFENQNAIKAATAGQQLLDYGVQAGLDRNKLSACINAKSSLPRVRQDFLEGEKLGVSSTPTFFINGKMITGAVPPQTFYTLIDQDLAKSTAK